MPATSAEFRVFSDSCRCEKERFCDNLGLIQRSKTMGVLREMATVFSDVIVTFHDFALVDVRNFLERAV